MSQAKCRSLEALYESKKARFTEQENMAKAYSKRCDDRAAVVATLNDQLVKAKAESQQASDAAREQAVSARDTKKALEQMCSALQQQQSTVASSSGCRAWHKSGGDIF